MFKQIAVLIGKDGQSSTVYEQGMVVVYEKEDEAWDVKNKIIFDINTFGGMNSVRERMLSLIESLGSCNVFVGKTVEGIPYSVLKKSGFTIVEATGSPEEFLDELLEMLLKNKKKADEKKAPIKETVLEPLAVDEEGRYFLDLEKAQIDNPGISSKKILLPFLRNKTFYELKITCGHVPPWLESELDMLSMKLESEKIGQNQFEVKICHKVCN